MKKLFMKGQNSGIIVFMVFSALFVGLCFFLLLPQSRLFILKYAEEYANITGRIYTPEKAIKFVYKFVLFGSGFYFFILFLITLERYTMRQHDEESFNWGKLFIVVITVLAIAIRIAGFNWKTEDYFTQSQWLTHLRDNGHFLGFKTFPGNYNAIYLYILGILSFFPQNMELYLMKIASCAFDFICAFYAMKIMCYFVKSRKIGLLTYAIILFSPTVFVNSGLWAQCDSMYTAFVLMAFYYLLKDKVRMAMFFFGVGLSFKLQSIFPLPFIILFFIYRKISFINLLYILIGFFVVSIPAWLFGWPLHAFFNNYIAGTNTTSVLTWNAPTIFTWGNIPVLLPVIFIAAVFFCIGFLIINKKSIPSNNTLLLLFLFCNFAIPFFLPNMHERYFYIGEIVVLLYSIVNHKRFWISLPVIMPTLATYSGYLWGTNPFSLLNLSIVILLAIIIITKWLIESILIDQDVVYSGQ